MIINHLRILEECLKFEVFNGSVGGAKVTIA